MYRNYIASIVWVCVCQSFVFAQLRDAATIKPLETRRSSSTDPKGFNADSLMEFRPGQSHVMLDTDGPGCIRHLWMTVSSFGVHSNWDTDETFLRDLVIRMVWENSDVPSVEVPLGDFFALGHARRYTFCSDPITVGQNNKALNCYWPMPFYRHAKIEIYNNGIRCIRRIYYNLDYEVGPIPKNQGLFHAEFRCVKNQPTQDHYRPNFDGRDNYVIMETQGTGQYMGCALFVDAKDKGWWGEGDEMIFVDRTDKPTILGTGSEDYFCNAWGFKETYSYPWYGLPLLDKVDNGRILATAYRWHVPDPVRFQKSIKVTIEHLYRKGILNDYSSVAYWYQTKPIQARPPLPKGIANHPRLYPKCPDLTKPLIVDGSALEDSLYLQGIAAHSEIGQGENGGWLAIDAGQGTINVDLPVPQDGVYQVEVQPYYPRMETEFVMGFDNDHQTTLSKMTENLPQKKAPYVLLGRSRSQAKKLSFFIKSKGLIPIDTIRLELIPDK